MNVASALNLSTGDLFILNWAQCTAPVPVRVSLNEKQRYAKSVTRSILASKELALGHVLTLHVLEFCIRRRVNSTKHTKGGY